MQDSLSIGDEEACLGNKYGLRVGDGGMKEVLQGGTIGMMGLDEKAMYGKLRI